MLKTNFIKTIAVQENVSPQFLEQQFKHGRVVIPQNKKRRLQKITAIGDGLKIKVNTNIGTSTNKIDVSSELQKLKIAIQYGTDTIMDLSTGGNLREIRKKIIANSSVPIGTVPIYEVCSKNNNHTVNFDDFTFDDIWDVLLSQAEDGVDFFTIHAGILKKSISMLKENPRIGGVVSRGGAILMQWMFRNDTENPFYTNFDKILELAKKYNITISLGDALRPGSIVDSSDELQLSELYVLGELVKKCRKNDVQVMVEGPGHIRFDEIEFNMKLQKKICSGVPFYVLGPLPIDIGAGYDHIVSAIGGALAAYHGANFLCVVTPAEHLGQPSGEDIKDGVIASKIAGHCVDVLRFPDEWQKNMSMSQFRSKRDWKNMFLRLMDIKKAQKYRKNLNAKHDICTMCGDFCSLKMMDKCGLL